MPAVSLSPSPVPTNPTRICIVFIHSTHSCTFFAYFTLRRVHSYLLSFDNLLADVAAAFTNILYPSYNSDNDRPHVFTLVVFIVSSWYHNNGKESVSKNSLSELNDFQLIPRLSAVGQHLIQQRFDRLRHRLQTAACGNRTGLREWYPPSIRI